jgi:hypothetical protein
MPPRRLPVIPKFDYDDDPDEPPVSEEEPMDVDDEDDGYDEEEWVKPKKKEGWGRWLLKVAGGAAAVGAAAYIGSTLYNSYTGNARDQLFEREYGHTPLGHTARSIKKLTNWYNPDTYKSTPKKPFIGPLPGKNPKEMQWVIDNFPNFGKENPDAYAEAFDKNYHDHEDGHKRRTVWTAAQHERVWGKPNSSDTRRSIFSGPSKRRHTERMTALEYHPAEDNRAWYEYWSDKPTGTRDYRYKHEDEPEQVEMSYLPNVSSYLPSFPSMKTAYNDVTTVGPKMFKYGWKQYAKPMGPMLMASGTAGLAIGGPLAVPSIALGAGISALDYIYDLAANPAVGVISSAARNAMRNENEQLSRYGVFMEGLLDADDSERYNRTFNK